MARQLAWHELDVAYGWRDLHGLLGPIPTFAISQQSDVKGEPMARWELNSMWIPCKQRRQVFDDIEKAKAAAQKIVDGFTAWIAG